MIFPIEAWTVDSVAEIEQMIALRSAESSKIWERAVLFANGPNG